MKYGQCLLCRSDSCIIGKKNTNNAAPREEENMFRQNQKDTYIMPAPSEACKISEDQDAFINEISSSSELQSFWEKYIAIGIKSAAVRSQFSVDISIWLSEANRYHPQEGWKLSIAGLRSIRLPLPEVLDLICLPTSIHDETILASFSHMGDVLSEMGYKTKREASGGKSAVLRIYWGGEELGKRE